MFEISVLAMLFKKHNINIDKQNLLFRNPNTIRYMGDGIYYIRLNGEKLNKLKDREFNTFINLIELRLRNCSLEKIEENAFRNLFQLKVLELTGTILSSLNGVNFEFLLSLEELIIKGSGLKKIPEGMIDHIHKLELLTLEVESLNKIPKTFFNNHSKMQEVNIVVNNKNITFGMSFDEVKALIQENGKKSSFMTQKCNVEKIFLDFFESKFKFLKHFKLEDFLRNKLSKLGVEDKFEEIVKSSGTRFFNPIYTKLYGIQFPPIISLDLSNLQISEIPPNFFANLLVTTVYLNDNNIKTLPEHLFYPFTYQQNLAGLDLENNKIESLPEKIFSEVRNLNYLNLKCNSLKTLPGSLSNLKKLEKLYLSGNPDLDKRNKFVKMQSSMGSTDFSQWMKDNPKEYLELVKFSTPQRTKIISGGFGGFGGTMIDENWNKDFGDYQTVQLFLGQIRPRNQKY